MTIHAGGFLEWTVTAALFALVIPDLPLWTFGQLVSDASSQSPCADESRTLNPSSQTSAQTSTPSPSPSQPQNPSTATTNQQKRKCASAANPNLRRYGCKDEAHDWDATLTRGWDGFRYFEDNNAFATLPLGNRSSNGNAGISILPHNFRLSEESSMAVVIAGVLFAGSLGGAI